MKTFLWVVLGIVVVGGIVFMMGPRITVNTKLKPVKLPKDLDAYLKQQEASVKNIRPNTEKIIVWADPKTKQQTPISIIYLHGFGATRKETDPLCSILAKAMGANLYYARLRGHGRDGDALGAAKAGEWLQDAHEAYEIGRRLGKKVLIAATSTGATIALWMAATRTMPDLGGLALFSVNIKPKDAASRVFLLPWGIQLAKLIAGKRYKWKPYSKQQALYWTYDHPIEALGEMMGLVQLLEKVDYSKIKVPTIVVYSGKDRVIDVSALRKSFKKLGSANKKMIDIGDTPNPYDHVIAGDIANPTTTKTIAEKVIAFFKPVFGLTTAPKPRADAMKKDEKVKPKSR